MNANKTLIILQKQDKLNKDFSFLEACFKKIIYVDMYRKTNMNYLIPNESLYLLAYEDSCNLAASFIKKYKLKVEAIFFISPLLAQPKKHLWIYSSLEKSIYKIKIPIVIFNANTESIIYQNCVADLIDKCRMVYNIVISSKKLNILNNENFAKTQILQAITSYINN